jgi:hypothetical protein
MFSDVPDTFADSIIRAVTATVGTKLFTQIIFPIFRGIHEDGSNRFVILFSLIFKITDNG